MVAPRPGEVRCACAGGDRHDRRRSTLAAMAYVLDADTHICEPAAMWDLLPQEFYRRRPVMAKLPSDTLYGGRNAVWVIDGNIFPKPAGKGGCSLATPCQTDFGLARTDIEIANRE